MGDFEKAARAELGLTAPTNEVQDGGGYANMGAVSRGLRAAGRAFKLAGGGSGLFGFIAFAYGFFGDHGWGGAMPWLLSRNDAARVRSGPARVRRAVRSLRRGRGRTWMYRRGDAGHRGSSSGRARANVTGATGCGTDARPR